ncbi:translin-associated factor X-interacting protein 1-like isoform X2 [Dysidea avara]|uniref:translin-associated factor X-interacting protein 1-like isoform X2 n=1 Tax=Dysidea avara TaxID=196820 RepID=UPI0033192A50
MAVDTGRSRRSLPVNLSNRLLPKISDGRSKVKVHGLSYSLSKSPNTLYNLPPASIIQSEQEIPPGQLDSWPVNSLKPVASNSSSGRRSKMVTSYQSTLGGRVTPTVPKPKFLEHLEEFLQKELRLLGCPSSGPCELRVQAHREVFEHLMEDFKTYKPLLSAIKNEYDLYVNYLQQQIAELEPLKTHLYSVKEECNRKVLAMRDAEKAELEEARLENRRLLSVIDRLRETELSLRSQVDKLQAELTIQYEQYKNEADARKLLISDINDLKFRQQEQKAEETMEEREDPVVLKLKLQRGREDLKAAHHRINQMLADYGDVVPRREHEQLQAAYEAMEAELETLKNGHMTLMGEHSTLQGVYKQLMGEKNEMVQHFEKLKRSATPRPEWSRCAEYIEGGAEKWAELVDGRSSDQLVDVLLAQIAGVDVSEIAKEEVFQGKGSDDDVPVYLRVEGAVPNRRINKDEGSRLISGFWRYKLSSTDNLDKQLDEILYSYLLSVNGSEHVKAIEDGYNLHDCCSRFAHEPYFALFTEVLSGEIDESVITSWFNTQAKLTEALNETTHEEGVMSVDSFQSCLCSCLPHKSSESMASLIATAKQSSINSTTINFITALSPVKRSPNGYRPTLEYSSTKRSDNYTKTAKL